MCMKTQIRLLCWLFLASTLWLASCQSSSNKPVVSDLNDQAETPIQTAAGGDESISATVPSTTVVEVERINTPTAASILTTTPEALRFIFPTPALSSVSAWRPPLYPTPWVPTPYDHFYFARPIAANEVNWPLANYRYGGVFFGTEVHTGIDIPVKVGTPIHAAGPGRITWAGYGLYRGAEDKSDPYGLAVVIRHDFGYQGQTLFTVYGHMSRIDVSCGQKVDTGDLLGLSGATGNVTGPHLHFEVRIGKNNFSRSRNPELWLSPPQGWGILAGRVMDDKANLLPRQEVIIESRDTGEKYSVKTYGQGGAANPDNYYKENMVIGDLPAGNYTVWVPEIKSTKIPIKITAGRVSFFSLYGSLTYNTNLPSTPKVLFQTPVVEPSLTP
jgi:murein DD-endopeptidase MepM/ murein hydrolase activator NlpD